MLRLLLGLTLALALLPLSFAQEAGPETQIKDELDPVARWMRSQQDRASGAYGDAQTTAWVLWAYGAHPRRYRLDDGFFMQGALDSLLAHQLENGAFAADGKTADAELTRVAAQALFALSSPATKGAYGKALAWLGSEGIADPFAGLLEPMKQGDEARKHVRQLMAGLNEGHWSSAAGPDLGLTARNSVDLCQYIKMFTVSKEQAPIVPLGPFTPAEGDAVRAAMQRGAEFLVQVAQDGKYGAPGQPDAGLTAMVIGGLQGMPQPRDAKVQAVIDGGLAWLAGMQHEDGSIHQGRVANYVTSAAVMALAKSGKAEYQPVIAKAQKYLLGLQADEGEGYSEGDRWYGGIGYGDDERPDLSNLQMALEALDASGLPKDHEAYQRAIKFLERCQNRSESNDISIQDGDVIITSGNDGGSAYMPGDSKAGYVTLPGGKQVPRSYGSMTYALLKSYVIAGLPADDARVKAAFDWLQKNYTLDVNPGFDTSKDPRAAYQGLFYYYMAMSRALSSLGVEELVDADGKAHAWRRELAGRLLSLQSKENGSWINRNAPRWWEGNPMLGTAYALGALSETLK